MKAQSFVLAFLAFITTSPLLAESPAFTCRLPDDANFVSASGGCKDVRTNIVFGGSAYRRTGGSWWTYNGAKTQCANLVEGGFSDWRMPTKAELVSASQHGGVNYLDYVGALNDYAPWSSTKKGNKAYCVRLFDAAQILHMQATGLDVLCVRYAP
jgi:hypothetical protein